MTDDCSVDRPVRSGTKDVATVDHVNTTESVLQHTLRSDDRAKHTFERAGKQLHKII